ncbi:MAG: glycoside hydrolase N-terminal domain-containing protein, partial [Bacteroidales bacterium]|nr:glycoside hydrolase N-terminal domain-containing protein [Bacteroidales bacterium]
MKTFRLITVPVVISILVSINLTPTLRAQLPVPERGFISNQPAETWEDGLICGNGTIGANIFGHPINETVIFTHERLFLPMGPPTMPPDQSERLFEIRSLIDRGLYKQATNLQFDLSGQKSFMYPDPFVPAFDLRIQMDQTMDIRDYMRSVNFQTGEAVIHWKSTQGVYERRMFVSRADSIAVLLLTGPGKGQLNCRLQLQTRTPSEKLGERKIAASNRMFQDHISNIKSIASSNTLKY